MRLKWPAKAKKKENIQNQDMMMTLDVSYCKQLTSQDIFKHQQQLTDHMQFKSLLEYMLVLDPKKRPSAD